MSRVWFQDTCPSRPAALRPHLAAALRDGAVTPDQVTSIDSALRKLKHCEAAAVEAGKVLLARQATQLLSRDLDLVAARLVEAIDPDGVLPVTRPSTGCAGSST